MTGRSEYIKVCATFTAVWVVAASLLGCAREECKSFRVTVEKVYEETCTYESDYPKCRVELSNGIRVNLEAPILDGDILTGCQRPNESLVRLWRVEQNNKSGVTSIGHYTN